jgi:hypothetical protein
VEKGEAWRGAEAVVSRERGQEGGSQVRAEREGENWSSIVV